MSVGIVQGTPLLDLEYVEDSACDTDMNVVMTGAGGIVEIQGTAEGAAFSRDEMDTLVKLADQGIRSLVAAQKAALWRHDRPSAGGAVSQTHRGVQRHEARPRVEQRGQARRTAWVLFAPLAAGPGRPAGARHRRGRGASPDLRRERARQGAPRSAASGCAAIADDSGLCVDALGGAPGVISAHYATLATPAGDRERQARRRTQQRAKLQQRLRGVATEPRASSASLVALRSADDPEPLVATGRWHGDLLREGAANGGFG